NTLRELARLKVFYVLVIFAGIIIGSSAVVARLSFQQEFQVLKDISLGAIGICTSLLAIIATARLLPQDLEDRTLYSILAKPVSRFEYLAGKLSGVLLLLAISTIALAACLFVALYLREQAAIADATRQFSAARGAEMTDAVREIHQATFTASLAAAVAMIFIKSATLAAITLAISTFATTNIFSVAIATSVYFIGHLQGTAREYWLQEQAGGWTARAFLGIVALVFPDLQQFNFADEVVAGAAIPLALFLKTTVLAGFYILFYLMLSAAVFAQREL
ncbi:MAG: ABC transporter permease, partial [Verrucomicrobiota bacterium]|nr:ABC transporter permease [Verrucomicrobiota bacterium]